jgi:hypothetical protein
MSTLPRAGPHRRGKCTSHSTELQLTRLAKYCDEVPVMFLVDLLRTVEDEDVRPFGCKGEGVWGVSFA